MPKYVSTRPIRKGIYRKRWMKLNRKRWIGTSAAVVMAVTHRKQGQIF